jgi:hypothetical protein
VRRKQRKQSRPHEGKNGQAGNGHTLAATATLPLPGKARVPAASVKTAADGRGAGGHFAKGNQFSRGNAFARRVAQHRQAIFETFEAADTVRVMRRLHRAAVMGDVPAAKVFLSYTLGKPAEQADPDALDLHEVRLLLSRPLALEAVLAAMESLDPKTAAAFIEKAHGAKGPDATAGLGKDRLGLLGVLRAKLVESRAGKG